MRIVDEFNSTVDREVGRMSSDDLVSVEQAMRQFDELVKAGAIQPERYKFEPIGTIRVNLTPC